MPISKAEMKIGNVDLGNNEDVKAQRLSRILWTQVVVMPLVFMFLGVVVAWRRRRI